jgi:hypothetical protein
VSLRPMFVFALLWLTIFAIHSSLLPRRSFQGKERTPYVNVVFVRPSVTSIGV